MRPVGLPHSETPGSQVASTFPGRFAGSRVLHRLRVPRHPPYALGSLPKAFLQVDGSSGASITTTKPSVISIVKEQHQWTLTGSNR